MAVRARLRHFAPLLGMLPLAVRGCDEGAQLAAESRPSAAGGCPLGAVARRDLGPGALRLRFVQYNVRRLASDSGEPLAGMVGSTLRRLQPTVVCLNEVDLRKSPEGLEEIAAAIGAEHIHFFGHVRGTYGNALISRLPILETRDVHLEGGTQLEWPKDSGQMHRIGRGMLSATLELPVAVAAEGACPRQEQALDRPPTRGVTVFCTHLDHISEEQRVLQMGHVIREMRELSGAPHLLLGDLNALCAEDYTEEEWAALLDRAARSGWAPPSDAECVRMLLREGYVDAFRAAQVGDGRPLEAGAAKFTAHVGQPMYRIDYAFISGGAAGAGFRLLDAAVDGSANGSDHFPLVVDLEFAGPGGACSQL